jgi:hypothetical protein
MIAKGEQPELGPSTAAGRSTEIFFEVVVRARDQFSAA